MRKDAPDPMPPDQDGGRGLATAGLAGVWLVVATALQLLRSPGVPPWDTLWQEDGGIFLTDALHHHLIDAVTMPYNGYLHFVPRLLAALAVHLPLRDVGWVFAVSSALIVSLVSVYVWWAARTLIPAGWARALLCLLVVLSPVSAYETDNNINNLHWYLLFALAFVPFSRPSTRWLVGLNLVVVVAAVLSDSEAVLLVPLFVPQAWRGLRRLDVGTMLTPFVVGVCLIIQLAVGASGRQPGRYTASHWRDLPGIYAFRVAGSFLLGDRYLPALFDRYGSVFSYACLLALAVLVAGAALRSVQGRPLLGITVLGSIAFLAVPLMLRGTENFLNRPGVNLNGSRYALLPVLFLATGLLGALGHLAPRIVDHHGRASVVPTAVALLVVGVVGYNYSDFNVRTPGPSWRGQLATAEALCVQTRDLPREHASSAPGNPWGTAASPSEVIVPVAPSLPNIIPFSVLIGCQALRHDLGDPRP